MITLPVIISIFIFIVVLIIIFSEKVNRTIVAMVGATLMVVAGIYFGFYNQEQAVEVVDFNTLGLLIGMMILVGLLEPTGFFQFLAVMAAKISKGKPIRLLIFLTAVTSLVSMVLDNVTTVVLIAPVTILICEILGYNTRPFLISEAILSNIGGMATLVGDPPNILIASAANFTFVDFLRNALPIVLVTWLVTIIVLNYLFRKELQSSKIIDNGAVVAQLNPKEAIKEPKIVFIVLVMIAIALIGFIFEDLIKLEPSVIAIGASSLALLWVNPSKVKEVFNLVEWDVLVFFSSLFILVGGLENAGVLHYLAQAILSIGNLPPVILGVSLLWIVALLSAIVDNIPITIAIIPVILELETMGIPVAPLWWALAFGAGLGGNGTIIGSTANVIVTSLSDRTRYPITPMLWNKKGLPVMFISLIVVSGLYVLFFFLFGF
ncbi:MAG: citrate transporter [Chloroflexi bacterium HGW-Chloroflexi-2]|jgi:Na+/H+ antiporter NhaD/arsenite permease-like protein|nr:MAG: citrate transporter [Chloroflexi bacterium HGW-Chloroflexi-2]